MWELGGYEHGHTGTYECVSTEERISPLYTPHVSMAKWTEHKNVWVLIVAFCASFSYYIESFGLILTEPQFPPHAFAKYLFKCGVSQFCLSHMWKCTLGRQKRHMIFVDPQHVKSSVVFNTDQVYTFFLLKYSKLIKNMHLKPKPGCHQLHII